MAKAENKKSAVPSNPMLIDWPRDVHGATSELKAAIIKACGQMNAQPDKLANVLEVLEIGFGHATARFESQVEENKRTAEWKASLEEDRAKVSYVKGYQP